MGEEPGGFRDADVLGQGPQDVARAADSVRARAASGRPQDRTLPRVGLILGSGLGPFVDGLAGAVSIPFADIPGFPVAAVAGHPGRLVIGERAGVPVAVQAGRFHVYEGLSAAEAAFPIRVLHALGVRVLVVTNAAGGVASRLRPGDLLLIEDHIHLQFRSPLRGRGPLLDSTRFVDLSRPYHPGLLAAAVRIAGELGIPRVLPGTYWSTLGPAYETPAEVRMIRALGGDAVGMSTVNEVLVARQLDLEVLGIACVANAASGLAPERLSHEAVLRSAAEVGGRLGRLLDGLLPVLAGAGAGD